MNDDIVTQLVMFSLDDGTDALNKLLVEAVNEIERLRAKVCLAELHRDHWSERFDQNQKCLDFIYKNRRRWF